MGNLIDTDGLDQYTDEITTFTSGDSSSPSSFTTIPVVASKEKPSSLFQKLSQAISNIRYLYNSVFKFDMVTVDNTYVSSSASWINYAPYSSSADDNKLMRVGNDLHIALYGVTTKENKTTGAVILNISNFPERFRVIRSNISYPNQFNAGFLVYFNSSTSEQKYLPVLYIYGSNRFEVNNYYANIPAGTTVEVSIFIPGAFIPHTS